MARGAQAAATEELGGQDKSYKLGPSCPTWLDRTAPYIESVSRTVTSVRRFKERPMIQLATDPNASRNEWRPAAPGQAQGIPVDQRRADRSGHAWPFISRQAERPAAMQPSQRAGSASIGS
jgi:hypothetical protein